MLGLTQSPMDNLFFRRKHVLPGKPTEFGPMGWAKQLGQQIMSYLSLGPGFWT